MTKHRFVCFLVSCFLMIGMFPSNLLAYTIDGKDVYEYSDGMRIEVGMQMRFWKKEMVHVQSMQYCYVRC